LGYNKTSKAYRIFVLAQRKTIVSIAVKLEEILAFRKSQELSLLVEDEEKETLKDEKCSTYSSSGSQTLGEEEELSPSNSARRPSWFELTLRDA
jgi:hypothetical protein